MTATIWKFELCMADAFEIMMPKNAAILSVQTQRQTAFIWALVDPLAALEARQFRLAGTGHVIDDQNGLSFVGTFQLAEGRFVGHLFEVLQ